MYLKLDAHTKRIIYVLRFLLDLGIGYIIGLLAFFIHWLTHTMSDARVSLTLAAPDRGAAWLTNTGFMLAFLVPALLGVLWQPGAGSSGVPGVIAFLNGCNIPNALTPKVWAVKVLGLCCSVASGLPAGSEGPMAQIGAMTALMLIEYTARPLFRGYAQVRYVAQIAQLLRNYCAPSSAALLDTRPLFRGYAQWLDDDATDLPRLPPATSATTPRSAPAGRRADLVSDLGEGRSSSEVIEEISRSPAQRIAQLLARVFPSAAIATTASLTRRLLPRLRAASSTRRTPRTSWKSPGVFASGMVVVSVNANRARCATSFEILKSA